MDHEKLIEMAVQIEDKGFSDVRSDAILKIAESSELLRRLNDEIKNKPIKSKAKSKTKKKEKKKSGTTLIEEMYTFKKEASKVGILKNSKPIRKSKAMKLFGNKIADNIAQTAFIGLGISVAGRMIDNVEKAWDKRGFNRKKRALVNFARKENPGLAGVSDKRLGRYLDSAYSVSPRVAKDPLSASAYINTAHAVGGVDLGTMKTLSDIQSKGGQSYTGNYDAVNNVSNDIMKQVI